MRSPLAPSLIVLSLIILLLMSAAATARRPIAHGRAAPGRGRTFERERPSRHASRPAPPEAGRRIAQLRSQLVAIGREEASGERTIGGARSQLRQLDLQEAELKLRMGRNQEALTRLLGALQMFQRNPPPALLVEPRSARDAVRAAILIKAITPDLEARAHVFAAQAEALKRVRRKADEASGLLFQAQSDVADHQARIDDLVGQKRALETQLYPDAETSESGARQLAVRSPSLNAFVGALDKHNAAAGAGAALPARLTTPVQGPVTRRFEQAGAGASARDRLHAKGWTWSTDPGAAVLSPVAGQVDYAGPLKDWGLVLIIDVGDHHVVLAGLASVDIATGRDVAAGEPVGKMGPGPDRPQLYVEIRDGAKPVDPARWFSA